MTKVRPDKIIMSSMTPGFPYRGIIEFNISVSGSIPNGGSNFTGTATVPSDAFVSGFYSVTGSSIFGVNDKAEIGNGYSGVDNALGMTTYVIGSKNGTVYTVTVKVNNYSGGSVTVPTQTVRIELYTFISPF